jgi:hypothetical protein
MAPNNQIVYIVSAIHCPAPDGINPNCYSITGAYASAAGAQAAMLAKAKELSEAPLTHWHGHPAKGIAEWKESPFKIEFKGENGDIGVLWVDERILGVEEVPITQTLKVGRLGMGHTRAGESNDWGMNDAEVEKTLSTLLRF